MSGLLNWLDDRTGIRSLCANCCIVQLPGGPRWRYVWPSTIFFVLLIQAITGIFLWMWYSPSSNDAWESVYYIQNELEYGWLLRGIHYYAGQVLVALMFIHFALLIITGAYRAPREFNFWVFLLLILAVLGMTITGYLLPWGAENVSGTKVRTGLLAGAPVIGPQLQQLVLGGAEYGHATLTRFFALHAGAIPGGIVALIFMHTYLSRRHGVALQTSTDQPAAPYWPDQMLRNMVACLAVLAAIIGLCFFHVVQNPEAQLGAPLTAPYDVSESFEAARPEWFFLFLFQFLKEFKGDMQVIGAIVIPTAVLFVFFIMPIIGRAKIGHAFNVLFFAAVVCGAVYLSGVAVYNDTYGEDAEKHHRAVAQAELEAERIVELAQSPSGIPVEGAAILLRNDPKIAGPKLFAQHCASCHAYDGHDGRGNTIEPEKQSAPDLKGFGSRQWLIDFMDPEQIQTHKFYGNTAFKDGDMAEFVMDDVADILEDEEDKELFMKAVAALSAEAKLPAQIERDAAEADLIEEGHEELDLFGCLDCHVLGDKGDHEGPLLTGWASRDWIVGILRDPAHKDFYGKENDRMPAYGEDKILTEQQMIILADWIREDWYRVVEE